MPMTFRHTHKLFSPNDRDAPDSVKLLERAVCRGCFRVGATLDDFPCEATARKDLPDNVMDVVGALLGRLDDKTKALDATVPEREITDLDDLLLYRAGADMIRLLLSKVPPDTKGRY